MVATENRQAAPVESRMSTPKASDVHDPDTSSQDAAVATALRRGNAPGQTLDFELGPAEDAEDLARPGGLWTGGSNEPLGGGRS